MAVNPDELAICKRRGHDVSGLAIFGLWHQCKWCGLWVRSITTLEEREDDPPESERSPIGRNRKD